MSWAQQYVRCGKRSCKSCPHGPYWYQYTWDKDTGKMRSQYRGRVKDKRRSKPDDEPKAEAKAEKPKAAEAADGFDALFSRRTITADLCMKALGLRKSPTRHELDERYRQLAKLHHPDRPGGSDRKFKVTSTAYSYLKAFLR